MNRPKGFGISLVLANCLWCFLVGRCLTADFQSFMNPAVLMSAQGLRSKRLKMGTTIAYGSRVLFCLFVLCPSGSVMKRKEESLACDIEGSISCSQMPIGKVSFKLFHRLWASSLAFFGSVTVASLDQFSAKMTGSVNSF